VTAEAEIFFAHLDQNRAQQLFGGTIFVFTGEMRYILSRFDRIVLREIVDPPRGARNNPKVGAESSNCITSWSRELEGRLLRKRSSGRCESMAASSRRIGHTGIGVMSPIGLTQNSFWEALTGSAQRCPSDPGL